MPQLRDGAGGALVPGLRAVVRRLSPLAGQAGGETLEGLFELDSRLWRTLPDLALRPARLTRRYLDGHRVAQIPPFRLFLIVVVLVFLAAGLGPPRKPVVDLAPRIELRRASRLSASATRLGAKDNGLQISYRRERARSASDRWLTTRLNAAAKNPGSSSRC